MKKSTMNSILSLIATINTPEAEVVRNEITAELNKGLEKSEANRKLYAEARDIVLSGLSETPITVSELYKAIEDKLPADFSKSKMQYALINYWKDDVVKHEGKVNTYTKA